MLLIHTSNDGGNYSPEALLRELAWSDFLQCLEGAGRLSHFSCVLLCVTLWTCSPPGSSVHGISQARILEWVAISFSRGSSLPRD